MRWLLLHARARQVPASAAALALTTLVVWYFTHGDGDGEAAADPRVALLTIGMGVTAAAVGLGGADVALERTAAIRWSVRRTAHVLLIATLVGAALLLSGAAGAELAPVAFIVRDAAGLTGLAALGATVCGAPYAWAPPMGWLAIALFLPAPSGTAGEIAGWMLLPPGTEVATWTASVLLAGGTALYAVMGERR
ncbi:hypothetical protein AB0P17_03500 [Streptomyces sp. NPDC088124]|uniref:hypothetical protein n=1 Tax=Streptomyces sp. NPDC088124 TaxID=3154654 RepID=UPI00342C3399